MSNSPFTPEEDAELSAIFSVERRQQEQRQQMEKILKESKKKIEDDRNFRAIELAVANAIEGSEYPKVVNNANSVMPKSLRREPVLCRVANVLSNTLDDVKMHKKEVIALTLCAALVLTPLMQNAKLDSQISKLTQKISNGISETNLGDKVGIFGNLELTENPKEVIEKLNISANNHMRLYILSLSLSYQDFDNILKELGYKDGIYDYLKHLGYQRNDYDSATELYHKEYSKKLKQIIKEININKELSNSYFEKYPELKFLYSNQNIYLTDDDFFAIDDSAGRSL